MATGTLFVVATPIGNLQDLSLRALEVLKTVDFIAAEDTRHSSILLKAFHLEKTMVALHDHNERDRSDEILLKVKEGKNVALISDAGTPLVSDPGYYMVRRAHEEGITVSPIPGCCAFVAALSAAGLPSDRFIFEGFLPAKTQARQHRLDFFKEEERTLIFYEAPHRIVETLKDMEKVFGSYRQISLCRELTKRFETIKLSSLEEMVLFVENSEEQQKGEFVLILAGHSRVDSSQDPNIQNILHILLRELPLKQAVKLASEITKANKNELYEWALKIKEG